MSKKVTGCVQESCSTTNAGITVILSDVGTRGAPGLEWCELWVATRQYTAGCVVRYENDLYIATCAPDVGTVPTNDSSADPIVTNTCWDFLLPGADDFDHDVFMQFFEQPTGAQTIALQEGDLVQAPTGEYYWALNALTLTSTTDLTNTSNFELRGNPRWTVSDDTTPTPNTGLIEAGDILKFAGAGITTVLYDDPSKTLTITTPAITSGDFGPILISPGATVTVDSIATSLVRGIEWFVTTDVTTDRQKFDVSATHDSTDACRTVYGRIGDRVKTSVDVDVNTGLLRLRITNNEATTMNVCGGRQLVNC